MLVRDYLEQKALEQIARSKSGYYAIKEYKCVLFAFNSDDFKKLEKWRELFGGQVAPTGGGPGSHYGDIRSQALIDRGYYRWVLLDNEAYLFCRKLLPYLARYDKYKFNYCQALMMEYMASEDYPD